MTERNSTVLGMTFKPCRNCYEPLENHGGFAWFHPNGLMLCDRMSPESETGADQ